MFDLLLRGGTVVNATGALRADLQQRDHQQHQVGTPVIASERLCLLKTPKVEKPTVLGFTAVMSPPCSDSCVSSFRFLSADSVAERLWN